MSAPQERRANNRKYSLKGQAELTPLQQALLFQAHPTLSQLLDMNIEQLKHMFPEIFAVERVVEDSRIDSVQEKVNKIDIIVGDFPQRIRDAVVSIAVAALGM